METVDVPKIERNSLGYLIAKSPYAWGALKAKILNNDFDFGRSEEMQIKYMYRLATIRDEWESIDDYCKHAFLDFPLSIKLVLRPDGSHGMVKYVQDDAKPNKPWIKIHFNEFPYFFSPGIQHYLLWSVEYVSSQYFLPLIEDTFPSSSYNVLWFENSLKKKSVKSVFHVHLVVRKHQV